MQPEQHRLRQQSSRCHSRCRLVHSMMGQQLFHKQLEHSSLGQRCCHSRCQLEHSMMGQQLFHKRLEHSSLGQHCSRCHSRYQLEQSSLGQLCSRCRTRLLEHSMLLVHSMNLERHSCRSMVA